MHCLSTMAYSLHSALCSWNYSSQILLLSGRVLLHTRNSGLLQASRWQEERRDLWEGHQSHHWHQHGAGSGQLLPSLTQAPCSLTSLQLFISTIIITILFFTLSSVQFSCSVVSDSLRPHGLQHARLPCPSPTPRACSNSCPSSWWCHPTISSSVVPFSSCLQSFQHQGLF